MAIDDNKYDGKPLNPYSKTGRTYIDKAADYLEARGLTITDCAIVPATTKNHGLYTEDGHPFLLEGWAFRIRDIQGEPVGSNVIMRVCNWPDNQELYRQDEKGKRHPYHERPKFLQTGRGQYIHWPLPFGDIINTLSKREEPFLFVHEKLTSATLFNKMFNHPDSKHNLNIPSISMSGCFGWGNGGRLHSDLDKLVRCLPARTKIIVCLDGDISTNLHVLSAASGFNAAVAVVADPEQEITMEFPQVPNGPWSLNGTGWDDYVTHSTIEQVVDSLYAGGVDLPDCLPVELLVKHYGVTTEYIKKEIRPQATRSNYIRLLEHPRWQGLIMDSNNEHVYRYSEDEGRNIEFVGTVSNMAQNFTHWLQDNVYTWSGKSVQVAQSDGVMVEHLAKNVQCMAVEFLRSRVNPLTTLPKARKAADKLLDAMFYSGPMPRDLARECILRLFRDIIVRWQGEGSKAQWVWSLIGPQGCGKSTFVNNIFSGLQEELGLQAFRISTLKAVGHVSKKEEMQAMGECLAYVADDYNPNTPQARDVENLMFSLCTTDNASIRLPYARTTTTLPMRAVMFLNTTDRTKDFIRSTAGTGERRFVVMEVGGGLNWKTDKKYMDRAAIKQLGLDLLTWGVHAGHKVQGSCVDLGAAQYASAYVQKSQIIFDLSMVFSHTNWDNLANMLEGYWRDHTEDYRLVLTTDLLPKLGLQKIPQANRADFISLCEQAGAVEVGKCRVNANNKDGWRQVAKGHAIKDLGGFLKGLQRCSEST